MHEVFAFENRTRENLNRKFPPKLLISTIRYTYPKSERWMPRTSLFAFLFKPVGCCVFSVVIQ